MTFGHSIVFSTPLAVGSLLPPMAVLLLCLVAGIGTVMVLPGRKSPSLAKVGGIVLVAASLVLAGLLGRGGAAGSDVFFWLFAAGAVGSALKVATCPKPVYSALYFVLTVISTAGLFILMWAEFMAAALVLIYAGAILVTYVFVIMLASEASTGASTTAKLPECDAVSREPLAASAVGFFLTGLLLFMIFNKMDAVAADSGTNQGVGVRDLGRYLFNNQIVSLELAGVLLTLGMVGAILIARRQVGTASGVRETFVAPDRGPDVSDDPHSIPVHGVKERENV